MNVFPIYHALYKAYQSVAPSPPTPPMSTCAAPWFNPFIYRGVNSGSGVNLSYTQSLTSQSVAIWARSKDMDVTVTAYEPSNGTSIAFDDFNGWNPPEDGYGNDNAAMDLTTNLSGSYTINLAPFIGTPVESASVYISPGPEFKAEWEGRSPSSPFYISSSHMVGIVSTSGPVAYVVFYDVSSSAIIQNYSYDGTLGGGGAWSKPLDKVFALVTISGINVIAEYDNGGTLLTSHSITLGNGFQATTYDQFNDRLFIVQNGANPAKYVIWDMATRATLHTGSVAITGLSSFATYVDVLNRYYVSSEGGFPMKWIDASTYVTGSTTTTMAGNIQYDNHTKLIGVSKGGVSLFDPQTDTIRLQVSNIGGDIFEGMAFDPCIQSLVLDWDKSTDIGGLIVLDPSASYSGSNFIFMYTHEEVNEGASSTYGLCFSEYDSKMYVVKDNFNSQSSSLSSVKVTAPTSYEPFPLGYLTNLYAYWDCENSSSDTLFDVAHGRNLGYYAGGLDGGEASSSVPGLIGRCFEWGATTNFNSQLTFRSNLGTDDSYYFGGDWTIRFWMKTAADAWNNAIINNVVGAWTIFYGFGISNTDSAIALLMETAANSYYFSSSIQVGDGAWHRVIVWYNSGSAQTGVQIDQNPPNVFTIPDPPLYNSGVTERIEIAGPTDFLPNPPDPSFLMDEIAIWKDYVLTDADKIVDWNGGVGITYPL